MKGILEQIRKDKVIHYMLIIMATCLASIPLIKLRLYGTDDGFVHILRTIGVEKIIESGQIPPYIYSQFCRGFGYGINIFYQPIVTYFPIIFKLFTIHYYDALKIYAFFTILISGFSMYSMLMEFTKKREVSLLGALIYIFIPYRLETIYHRFAIGEFSAYMFIPLVFLGLHSLLKGDGKKHYFITIGATCLLLTHTISTVYTAIFALLYIVMYFNKIVYRDYKKNWHVDWAIIKKILINVAFIIIISAFFIIPLIESKLACDYSIFSATSMCSKGSDVQNTGISLFQFFVDNFEREDTSFKLGIPLIIFTLLGVFTYRKIDNKSIKEDYIFFVLMAILSLWMATRFFPWIILPNILTTIQFSWRMVMFLEFALSVLCAMNIYTLIQIIAKDKEKVQDILITVFIILITIGMTKISYNYKYEVQKSMEDFDYEEWVLSQEKLSHYSINREYLPSKADNTYIENREDKVYILSGEANITDEAKHELELKFAIEDAKEGTVLELPYIYYVGYNVTIENNNEITKLSTFESENGFVAIQIPENIEKATIKVEYKGTILQKVSYIISAIALILFIVYIKFGAYKSTKSEQKG